MWNYQKSKRKLSHWNFELIRTFIVLVDRINCIHAKLIGTHVAVFVYSCGMMMERLYCLISHHVSTLCIPVDICFKHGVSPCLATLPDCQTKQMPRRSQQLPLWRTGGDHQDATVLHGWRLSSRTWNSITSPWMKQLTRLRIIHSETDVYVWGYALLVVHVRRRRGGNCC